MSMRDRSSALPMTKEQAKVFRSRANRTQMRAAADRVFLFATEEAEKVSRLPLSRVPQAPILAEIMAHALGITLLAVTDDEATQIRLLDLIHSAFTSIIRGQFLNGDDDEE